MASYQNALPTSYSRQWISRARGYWRGSHGDLATPMTRMVRARWPRVPPALFLGFIANATREEDTGAIVGEELPNPRFHEIGWFGTEAGLVFAGPTAAACMSWWMTAAAQRQGPRPACAMNPSPVADARAPYNHWGLLASDPRVTRLLGRNATMADRGWSVPEAIPDQVAVGLTNVGDHADAVNNRLPPSIRARDPQSSWFWNLGFMGWSAGDGRAVSHLSRYANVPAVVAAPENRRLGEVLRAAATEALAPGFYAGTPKSHANRFYTLSRALQKRRVGQDLCAETGFDPAWFGLGLPNEDALVDVIVRAGYGAPLAGQTLPAGDVRPPFDVGAIALDRRADLAADYASNTSRQPPGVITRLRHFFLNY